MFSLPFKAQRVFFNREAFLPAPPAFCDCPCLMSHTVFSGHSTRNVLYQTEALRREESEIFFGNKLPILALWFIPVDKSLPIFLKSKEAMSV